MIYYIYFNTPKFGMDISTDPRFIEFLQSRPLKPMSIRNYTYDLSKYVEFTGLTLTELITEAEKEEDERLRMRSRKIKTYLLGFREHLINQDLSNSHIQHIFTTVRTFYSEFEIELPRIKLILKSRQKETINDIPTRDHIQIALENSNRKMRAIILLMLSSGMGRGEVLSLKYSDLLRSIHDDIKISKSDVLNVGVLTDLVTEKLNENILIVPSWNIHRVKTGMLYSTFCTSECLTAILKYLSDYPPHSLNDPLFRTAKTSEGLKPNTFLTYFWNLNKKCGFGQTDRIIFFHSHALRKYFATTLFKNKIPQIVVDWLLGHKIDNTSEAYFKADTKALKEQYITCIPDLSIEDTEVHTYESPEFVEIKEEMSFLKKEVQHLRELNELKEPITKK